MPTRPPTIGPAVAEPAAAQPAAGAARPVVSTYRVGGMHCAACAAAVEQALVSAGAADARVLPADDTAYARWNGTPPPFDVPAAAVARAGYRLSPADAAGDDPVHGEQVEAARRARALTVGLVCTVPLAAAAMARDAGFIAPEGRWFDGLLIALALPVHAYTALPFYAGALAAVRSGRGNMDLLVTIGAGTALVQAVTAVIARGGGHTFIEAGATVLTLVTLGKYLEARARRRAARALTSLTGLTSSTAHLLDDRGDERDVPGRALMPGDRCRVRPHETFPVDAIVESGTSAVDESLLTGESLPVDKGPGATVLGGTRNLQGVLVVRARTAAAGSLAGRIGARVRGALAARAPVEQVLDRWMRAFVPAILVVAAVTLVAWVLGGDGAEGVRRAVAVLVVACPCAMGLAVPVALVAAVGRGAASGLFIRDAAALERLAKIRTVAFDKTGTLTRGRPVVTAVTAADGGEPDAGGLGAAAALAAVSNHPVARAFAAWAAERGVAAATVSDAEEFAGLGVQGFVDGGLARFGKPGWAARAQPGTGATDDDAAQVVLGINGRRSLTITPADTPRPEAAAVVAALRARGIRSVVLTGDADAPARAVARAVGIAEVHARVSPDDKRARVAEWKAAGPVAMVGDGTNDAPALAEADVGVAVGTGADAAVETADVTLIAADLRGLVRAIDLARFTRRITIENLAWAFGYNLLLVPVAAGAFAALPGAPTWLAHLHPGAAAAAMALSSLSVVFNALRITRFGVPAAPAATAP